ncbi:hypothetical protein JHW43_004440 [Diplocarpon mali]|nr:hypothetical protein JHW43_004440 [Diplocarpon mali]
MREGGGGGGADEGTSPSYAPRSGVPMCGETGDKRGLVCCGRSETRFSPLSGAVPSSNTLQQIGPRLERRWIRLALVGRHLSHAGQPSDRFHALSGRLDTGSRQRAAPGGQQSTRAIRGLRTPQDPGRTTPSQLQQWLTDSRGGGRTVPAKGFCAAEILSLRSGVIRGREGACAGGKEELQEQEEEMAGASMRGGSRGREGSGK